MKTDYIDAEKTDNQITHFLMQGGAYDKDGLCENRVE